MPDRKQLERLIAEGSVNPEMLAIRSEEAERLREDDSKTAVAVSHRPGAIRSC